jgi:hypothetical protein
MKTLAIALGALALLAQPTFGQSSRPPSQVQSNQPSSNQGHAQTQPVRQQVQRNLEEAGYTDINIMPESLLVRAKDRSGNPVLMIINPDSITAITQFNSGTGSSETTGSAAGVGERAVNSGAGVRGLPGSKSGPAITPAGKTAEEPDVTRPDQSGVPGLPGSKSGPAVQPSR